MQRNPGKIAGTMPSCGALGGLDAATETAMTVLYTWKTLIDPSLKVAANYAPGASRVRTGSRRSRQGISAR